MSKILLVSQDTQQKELIVNVLTGAKSSATLITSVDESAILNYVEKGQVDMVIIDEDTTSPDTVILAKKLHSSAIKENVAVAALVNYDTCNTDLLRLANVYITKPINEKILCSCVNGSLKLKKAIDTLSTNNSELAKSLYQLDVLYNTSMQLAGSLDKQKLINIMLDGLEKSLSFSLSYILVFNDEHNIDLIINSLYNISPRLEHSLKLRAILSYRALFDKKRIPYNLNVNDIKVIKNIKHPIEEYDLNI